MKAVFFELPAFHRYRERYLDDEGFQLLQCELLENPTAGSVIVGTGGLRKLRVGNQRKNKGKRGGLRIIYYWWEAGRQMWLFTIYDKAEMVDLNYRERRLLAGMLQNTIESRSV